VVNDPPYDISRGGLSGGLVARRSLILDARSPPVNRGHANKAGIAPPRRRQIAAARQRRGASICVIEASRVRCVASDHRSPLQAVVGGGTGLRRVSGIINGTTIHIPQPDGKRRGAYATVLPIPGRMGIMREGDLPPMWRAMPARTKNRHPRPSLAYRRCCGIAPPSLPMGKSAAWRFGDVRTTRPARLLSGESAWRWAGKRGGHRSPDCSEQLDVRCPPHL